MRILVFLLMALFSLKVDAESVFSDLSMRKIEIDSSFIGTNIYLFGAKNDPGEIVVVVRGEKKDYIIRKKERVFGVWMNKRKREIKDIYNFYFLASTEIRTPSLLKDYEIGLENLKINAQEEYKQAFFDKMQQHDLYPSKQEKVHGETLFKTNIFFPEKIPSGKYVIETYLFNDDRLVGYQAIPFLVEKVGFDALIYNFAHKLPLLYGFFAVIMALILGCLASILFKKI